MILPRTLLSFRHNFRPSGYVSVYIYIFRISALALIPYAIAEYYDITMCNINTSHGIKKLIETAGRRCMYTSVLRISDVQ
jgi:hypothetical protein